VGPLASASLEVGKFHSIIIYTLNAFHADVLDIKATSGSNLLILSLTPPLSLLLTLPPYDRKTLEGSQEVLWMREGSHHYGHWDRILGVSEEEMPASEDVVPVVETLNSLKDSPSHLTHVMDILAPGSTLEYHKQENQLISDDIYIKNQRRTWERLLLTAPSITATENPADISIFSSRNPWASQLC
ncbi:hypothetical protein U0070_004759, partial [Myodes glareolus]